MKSKPSKKRPRTKTKKPTATAVRAAGVQCASMAEAAERLGVGDLAAVLKRSKTLTAAWERGRFLRRVDLAASECFVKPEKVGREVQLPPGKFFEIYKKDPVVRDLWDRRQTELFRSLKAPLVARAKEGDPKAVAAVQTLFVEEAPPAIDFERLRPLELQAAVDIDYRTLGRWSTEQGLPRNADGSYSLPKFVAWVRRWELKKAGAKAAGSPQPQGETALERLRRAQADELEGRLVPREEVLAILRARAAWLKTLLGDQRANEWAGEHAGQTEAQLKEKYRSAFRALLARWCRWPDELEIPTAAEAKFQEAMALLMETDVQ